MPTHHITPSIQFTELETLVGKKYSTHNNFEFFLKEYENAYRYCENNPHISFFPIGIRESDVLIAHCALIIDQRLPPGEAFFGFLEVPQDPNVFNILWKEMRTLGKDHALSVLKGPVNGSIWHQYRCIKKTSERNHFKTEPLTPLYYYDLLKAQNPIDEVTYSSGARTAFSDIVLQLGKKKEIMEKLAANGFKIVRHEKITLEQLMAIAGISKMTFLQSWGYTELTKEDFLNLYDPKKINDNIHSVYFLYKGEKIVGFCSTMREGDILICKTICIIPTLQGIGLGKALAFIIHTEAERDGIKEIQYVLVRDGNQVHNFPTEDIIVFRQYAAFDFDITS